MLRTDVELPRRPAIMTGLRRALVCLLVAVALPAAPQAAPWSRVGPQGALRQSALAGDGSLFAVTLDPAGEEAAIRKLDPAGSVEWVHPYPPQWTLQAMAATPDGGLVAVFHADAVAGTKVVRIGSAGQLVWSKRISPADPAATAGVVSVAVGPAGEIHLAGTGSSQLPQFESYTILVTLSALGQLTRAVRFVGDQDWWRAPVAPDIVHAAADGALILAGSSGSRATILNVGPGGEVDWARQHAGTAGDALYVEAARGYDGGEVRLVVTHFGNGQTTLVVLGAGGAVEQLLTRPALQGTAVLLADKGYAAAGRRVSAEHPEGRLAFRRVSGFGGAVTREYDVLGELSPATFGLSAPPGGDRFTFAGHWYCPDANAYHPVVASLGAAGESCHPSAIVASEAAPPGAPLVFENLPVSASPLAVNVDSDDGLGTTEPGEPWAAACVAPCVQPPALTFAFTDPQKVLLHKYRTEDDYPSAFQQSLAADPLVGSPDGHLDVRVRATRQGAPVAGHRVYLRVTDPPDPSPYLTGTPDDNRDPALPKGRLIPAARCPGTTDADLCTIADADGWARVILETSDYVSGENYIVQASHDPSFSCGSCPESGTITTWKRIYVEVNRMFRRGRCWKVT